MKKLLLLSTLGLSLVSCDLKDKNGNAPLVENEEGEFVDNPNYKTDQQIKYDENMQSARAEYKASEKDDGSNVTLTKEPTITDRENFAVSFKPKTGKNEITLSGKNKTTIKFTGWNTEYTLEQFDNLDYFSTMKSLGFTKVLFSNGTKTVGTRSF
ncbi:MAG: hypothetical protein ACOH1X_02920 [Kaistella sp.]